MKHYEDFNKRTKAALIVGYAIVITILIWYFNSNGYG